MIIQIEGGSYFLVGIFGCKFPLDDGYMYPSTQ